MLGGTPAHALVARKAILEARERMTREARASGYWIVAPGEHLRLIARQFFPGDRPRQRRLRDFIYEHNPRAFVSGNPDRLIVGARLELPPYVIEKPEAAPSAAKASPQRTPPPSPAASPVTVPAPEFAVGPPPRAAPPKPKPYVDQLIEGGPAESEASIPVDEAAMAPGQRYFSAEYRAEGRYPPGGGHGLEQGLELHARRETLDYGDLYLEAGLRDTSLAAGDASVQRRDGARFTLYQQHFPVVEGWLADSALGVVRTPPNFLNSSYRIFLPTSLFSGASSVISDGSQTITAYGGHVGRLEGSAVQSFDPTSGNLAGLGYLRRFGRWTLGGQALSMRGSSQVPDHDAASAAAEYGSLGSFVHDKLQVVADTDSHFGAWFDGDVTHGRMRNRFGAYQLDPDLQWGDAPMVNDQRGAYWRGDYRMLRYTVAGGVDLAQTNIRDDPSRSATRSGTAYGTFSLRIDRNLSVGGGLTYQGSRSRFTTSPRASVVSANGYLSWTGPIGLTRFDATGFRGTATDVPDNTIQTVSWSQEWPALEFVRFSSTLTYARESSLGARTDRSSLGVSAHGSLLSGALWDASVVYGRVEGVQGNEDNVNVSATATWPFARHWQALAQVSVNTFDAVPVLPGTGVAATQRDKRVLVGLRYEESSGTPYQALGMNGGAGSGRLSGVVFFDGNGDGIREPTERGVPNVTVDLDERFPVTTDSQGRFSFSVVTPGSHALRILNDALPLPWTTDEDHPPVANVPLRGEGSVDIPLTKIRP